MIRVEFDPAVLSGDQADWWDRWEKRAARASADLKKEVAAGNQPSFRSGIWQDLKVWLHRHIFDRKCAYCEKKLECPESQAEHWRPKLAVTEGGRAVEMDGVPHPGYWWVAYEWTNLVPACASCNSTANKGNEFPVERERVFGPDGGETANPDRSSSARE